MVRLVDDRSVFGIGSRERWIVRRRRSSLTLSGIHGVVLHLVVMAAQPDDIERISVAIPMMGFHGPARLARSTD
jgi:hypothetical protein